jgi:hypothetical protein
MPAFKWAGLSFSFHLLSCEDTQDLDFHACGALDVRVLSEGSEIEAR